MDDPLMDPGNTVDMLKSCEVDALVAGSETYSSARPSRSPSELVRTDNTTGGALPLRYEVYPPAAAEDEVGVGELDPDCGLRSLDAVSPLLTLPN